MRRAGLVPELRCLLPVGRRAGAARGPYLDADRRRIASGLACQTAQFVEDCQRGVVGRIGVRHPAVAPLGDARQRQVVMSAIPYRHATGRRTRIDPRVVDRVVLALERHMRVRPQRLHHLHLLFRPPAAVLEVLIEADVFDLVPADADTEAEASAAQHVQARGLLRHQHGLPLRQDQHAGGEAELRRAARQEAEQHEWIMEQVVVVVAVPAGAGSGIDAQHVVGRFEEVIAQGFQRSGQSRERQMVRHRCRQGEPALRVACRCPSLLFKS